ncbi:MAG: AraC-like DNA-binding protein/quercetin dioxygenase-like cupin family protein [Arcticibacterium sp.]
MLSICNILSYIVIYAYKIKSKRQLKAVYEHISKEQNKSVAYRTFELPAFDSPFHYHPEYELTYIVKGDGLRYVGSRIDEFTAGELVLLGPNLPHCWLNRPLPECDYVKAFVIQFNDTVLKDAFLHLPEFDSLTKLLSASRGGVVFENHHFNKQWKVLSKLDAARQFLKLVEILLDLSEKPRQFLLNHIYEEDKDQQRFQAVFSYIIEHFRENISLEKVADIAHLSPTSFCRYFKKLTGNTLLEVVLEYRLKAASQLLLHTSKRINEIALSSGFEDIPYFNRAFKRWKGESPKVFRGRLASKNLV